MARTAVGRRIRVTVALAVLALVSSSCTWVVIASVSTGGAQADGNVVEVAISGDGRYVVFRTDASTLSTLANGFGQIYRRDLVTGTTELVSRPWACGPCPIGNSASAAPDISDDGRYVVFHSAANNLIPNDTNNVNDVFRVDMVAGTIERISLTDTGAQPVAQSFDASISADGTRIAFTSDAGLTAGDTNGFSDIFLRDTVAGTTELVSPDVTNTPADNDSWGAEISGDGQAVAFVSSALDLTTSPWGPGSVYLRKGGTTTAISFNVIGLPGAQKVVGGLDDDGDRIVVSNIAGTLFPSSELRDDTGALLDDWTFSAHSAIDGAGTRLVLSNIFFQASLVDLAEPANSGLISSDNDGVATGTVWEVAISRDGRTAAYVTPDDFLPGDSNGVTDVIVTSVPRVNVFSVTPAIAPAGQSTPVTITGSGFDTPVIVSFGAGTTTSNVVVVDSTTITATVTIDAGATGTRPIGVTVRNPATGILSGSVGRCVDCLTLS